MVVSEEGKWPNPDNWTRYSKDDHDRLRHQFSGASDIETNWSQSYQDMFVLSMLDGKKNGVYVEIGADQPRIVSNTYVLETEFDWVGVSFELESEKVDFFNTMRSNKCICGDATTVDYGDLFKERNYPKQIDYLSLDIEPAEQTLNALKVLPLDEYRFSVITYETDLYRDGPDSQDEQIRILKSHGYDLVIRNVSNEGNPYEDWWVDPNVIDSDLVNRFRQASRLYKDSRDCIFTRR
tara:strand:- start:953 stop:1663 length:711 start_codon:yes stop_codon:yes gene_type:complete